MYYKKLTLQILNRAVEEVQSRGMRGDSGPKGANASHPIFTKRKYSLHELTNDQVEWYRRNVDKICWKELTRADRWDEYANVLGVIILLAKNGVTEDIKEPDTFVNFCTAYIREEMDYISNRAKFLKFTYNDLNYAIERTADKIIEILNKDEDDDNNDIIEGVDSDE